MVTVVRSLDTHLVESRRNYCALNPGNRVSVVNIAQYTSGTQVSMTYNAANPVSASGYSVRSVVNSTDVFIGPVPTMLNAARAVQGGLVTVAWKGRWTGGGPTLSSSVSSTGITAELVASSGAFLHPVGETRQMWATFQMTRDYVGADQLRWRIANAELRERAFELFEFDVYPGAFQPGRAWFFGATPAVGDRSYSWLTSPDASPSIEWLRQPVVNVSPLVVNGFAAARAPGSLVHPILGRPDPDVTFRPGGLRTGTLTLIMPDAATAHAAVAGLLTPRVFELADTDLPELAMRFVVSGEDVGLALEDVTRKRWIVTVPFQEVTA